MCPLPEVLLLTLPLLHITTTSPSNRIDHFLHPSLPLPSVYLFALLVPVSASHCSPMYIDLCGPL